jgi:hypothetical protein
VLFGQLCRVALEPMQASLAPHDQARLVGDGLAESEERHQRRPGRFPFASNRLGSPAGFGAIRRLSTVTEKEMNQQDRCRF